mmetsp:Transcript_26130/g.63375  ORF Transcript_26130/g.63375 Transcript_26130/m.63375 type:complete len:334 (+) Transcript_26130:499-1500(+)
MGASHCQHIPRKPRAARLLWIRAFSLSDSFCSLGACSGDATDPVSPAAPSADSDLDGPPDPDPESFSDNLLPDPVDGLLPPPVRGRVLDGAASERNTAVLHPGHLFHDAFIGAPQCAQGSPIPSATLAASGGGAAPWLGGSSPSWSIFDLHEGHRGHVDLTGALQLQQLPTNPASCATFRTASSFLGSISWIVSPSPAGALQCGQRGQPSCMGLLHTLHKRLSFARPSSSSTGVLATLPAKPPCGAMRRAPVADFVMMRVCSGSMGAAWAEEVGWISAGAAGAGVEGLDVCEEVGCSWTEGRRLCSSSSGGCPAEAERRGSAASPPERSFRRL